VEQIQILIYSVFKLVYWCLDCRSLGDASKAPYSCPPDSTDSDLFLMSPAFLEKSVGTGINLPFLGNMNTASQPCFASAMCLQISCKPEVLTRFEH